MSVLSAFNKIVQDFLEDCILIFPEDNDFKIYKKAIDVLVKYIVYINNSYPPLNSRISKLPFFF